MAYLIWFFSLRTDRSYECLYKEMWWPSSVLCSISWWEKQMKVSSKMLAICMTSYFYYTYFLLGTLWWFLLVLAIPEINKVKFRVAPKFLVAPILMVALVSPWWCQQEDAVTMRLNWYYSCWLEGFRNQGFSIWNYSLKLYTIKSSWTDLHCFMQAVLRMIDKLI